MTMSNTPLLTLNERLSALADGELPAEDIGSVLDALEADPTAYEVWTTQHACAAAIRGEQIHAASGEVEFWAVLQKRLDAETMLPWSQQPQPVTRASLTPVANEPFWKMRYVASLAMVFAVGGMTAVLWPSSTPEESIAAVVAEPATAVAEIAAISDGSVMLRNPELDALMAAHQQMGGHSAWQATSGFLRSATYERPGR
jgi:sigma-E factor negative regulatory protein RseA